MLKKLFNKLSNRYKTSHSLLLVFLTIIIIFFLGTLNDMIYNILFKKKIIEANNDTGQNSCNINSQDSPVEISKKFNKIQKNISNKIETLNTKIDKLNVT